MRRARGRREALGQAAEGRGEEAASSPAPPPLPPHAFRRASLYLFLRADRPGPVRRCCCQRRCAGGALGTAALVAPLSRGMRIRAGRARVGGGQRGWPGRLWEHGVVFGNAAGTASPLRGHWSWIRPLREPPAVRLLCGVSCASCCSARRLKGPKLVNKAHLQGRSSPCQITISGFFEARLLPSPCSPVRGNADSCSFRIPELGTAARVLQPPFPPITSAATALKHELRRRSLVTCPSSFKGAGLRSLGGFRLCVCSTPAARGTFSSGRSQCVRAMR